DVGLGRKVHNGVGLKLGKKLLHGLGIGDVGLDEVAAPGLHRPFYINKIAGIGEEVDHDHPVLAAFQDVVDKVAADEAGSAGDNEGAHGSFERPPKKRA